MKKKSTHVIYGAILAALYVVLTLISGMLGLSSGLIQLRLSEALCVFACFTPYAIPGLTIGCLVANMITGAVIWDVLFGTLATFLGVLLAYVFRGRRAVALCFPVLTNTLILPFVLKLGYGIVGNVWYMFLTIGLGEILSCGILGSFLGAILEKYKRILFRF